jgi:hypothetical protein
MKRLLPVLATGFAFVATLALSAGPALADTFATGVNLSWNDCGAFGSADKAFACNVNTGSQSLFGSFWAPAGLDSVNGHGAVTDIITTGDPLPDWWRFTGTNCRSTSMSVSFDFTGGPSNCFDYWNGQATGGFVYQIQPSHPDGTPFTNQSRRARLKTVCAVAGTAAGPIAADLEVYTFRATINNLKTTGVPTCAGCSFPGCIVLNEISITQNAHSTGGKFILSGVSATHGGRDWVTWQGGDAINANCSLVPTKNRTWGQIKSMYR